MKKFILKLLFTKKERELISDGLYSGMVRYRRLCNEYEKVSYNRRELSIKIDKIRKMNNLFQTN